MAIIAGLDFPGSGGGTYRFRFPNPHTNGLPIYGASQGEGITYIWESYTRQQAGYYTTFFWGNDDGNGNLDTFLWDGGGADSYYGFHPYPQTPPSGNTHDWEISVEQNDYTNGAVVYDTWHVQGARVWRDASDNTKHHIYYWDLPNVDASHIVTRDSPSTWGNTNPPSPHLTWGDAPWAPGNEVHDGILRGIRIYNALLSEADMLSESVIPLSTAAGANSIWYLNMDPTPTDISDKSGNGHHPEWVGSNRPSLYLSGEGGLGHIYNLLLTRTAVSAAVDLAEIFTSANQIVVIHAIELSQSTRIQDANDEILQLAWKSGQTTSGSGGSIASLVPRAGSIANPGVSAEIFNTTKASAGTIVTHAVWDWPIRSPFQKIFTPETRLILPPSTRVTLELVGVPAASVTIGGNILLEVIG